MSATKKKRTEIVCINKVISALDRRANAMASVHVFVWKLGFCSFCASFIDRIKFSLVHFI